jgi:hypothetical protein
MRHMGKFSGPAILTFFSTICRNLNGYDSSRVNSWFSGHMEAMYQIEPRVFANPLRFSYILVWRQPFETGQLAYFSHISVNISAATTPISIKSSIYPLNLLPWALDWLWVVFGSLNLVYLYPSYVFPILNSLTGADFDLMLGDKYVCCHIMISISIKLSLEYYIFVGSYFSTCGDITRNLFFSHINRFWSVNSFSS